MSIITVSNETELRSAIASATAGDTIELSADIAISGTSGIVIPKNLTIDGKRHDGKRHTISGNNLAKGFVIERQIEVNFKNLTVTGCKTTGRGGAIETYDYASIATDNCEFNNNSAKEGGAIAIGYGVRATVTNSSFDANDGSLGKSGFSGGAIATKGAGNLIVKGSTFTNNKGVNGGAIYSLLGRLIVEKSVFKGNSSEGDMGGGAIFTDGANPIGPGSPVGGIITVRSSHFEGNRTKGEGGALFLYGYTKDKITLEDSTVIGNSAGYNAQGISRGGGVRANSALTIKNVTIANNIAGKQGGALWIDNNSSVDIINSTFSGNKVTHDAGGAMFIGTDASSPVNIVNSTIVNNSAGRASGAIMFGGNKNVTLTNSIVAFNTAGDKYQTQVTTSLKDGGGNIEWPKPGYGDRRVVSGSKLVDPLLDDLQQVNGILLHPLKAGSPAINAGVQKNYVPTLDQGRVQRDTQPDVGAFEYGNRTPVPYQSEDSPSNYIYGTFGKDSLVGGENSNIILGGYGDDTMIGGGGNDILLGGAGIDRYVYRSFADKGDVIAGFDATKEVIHLQFMRGLNFASPTPFESYVRLGQAGSNALVKVNPEGDRSDVFQDFLTIRNVKIEALSAKNFAF